MQDRINTYGFNTCGFNTASSLEVGWEKVWVKSYRFPDPKVQMQPS